jgi:RHS repeat-associated protein
MIRPHRGSKRRGCRVACLLGALLLSIVPCLARGQSEVVEYYHLDAAGNVRAVTNQAGQVIERHDYLPFGEECTTGPCASNSSLPSGQPRQFTGKERDPETGLDYFGARYYGSSIGRFTTVDPVYTWQENILDPQRWNRYAYARNNPLRYTDPDGRAIDTIADIGFIGWDVFDLGRSAYRGEGTTGTQWLALGGDVLGAAIPFATGIGAAIRAGSKVEHAVEAGRAVERLGEAAQATDKALDAARHADTLRPGPFAAESIPAHRGRPTAAEQRRVNELMETHGCHTCGTKNAGTKSGNAIADHQPPQALAEPKVFLPHCNGCKARQGGQVLQELRKGAQ